MITRQPIDQRDLHDLLRYDEQHPLHELVLTLQQEDSSDVATLTTHHQPGQSVTLIADRARSMLQVMLAHYPAPVSMNGEWLPRSDFDTRPAIYLISTDPPTLPGPEQYRIEHLDDTQRIAATMLCDGLLYLVARREDLGKYGESTDQRAQLRLDETIACSNPEWQPRHVMPAQRYEVEHSLIYITTDEDRPECRFLEIAGANYFFPSPKTAATMEPQMERTRQIVRSHAEATGRTILGHPWKVLTRAWHPGYDDLRLLLHLNTTPIKLSPDIPRPIRWAIAEALLECDQHGLVPVSDGESADLWLQARNLIIQTGDGNHHTMPCNSELRHALQRRTGTRNFLPAKTISIDCALQSNGNHVRDVVVALDLLPTGWIDTPIIIYLNDAVQNQETTAHRLARAYNRWRADDDHYPPTLQAAQVLAKQLVEGERQGFETALQQLADSFQPDADPPDEAITVTSADGRHTLRWSPDDNR